MVRKKITIQGRNKFAIEKITSKKEQHVCFSKRRKGIFTKATDLASICGADVAIVVTSPSGNPYFFGNPTFNTVTERYLSGNMVTGSSYLHRGPAPHVNLIQAVHQQCMDQSHQMEISIARKSDVDTQLKSLVDENPICQLAEIEKAEDLRLTDLLKLEETMVGLLARLQERARELMRCGGASSSNDVRAVRPLIREMSPFLFGSNQPGLGNEMSSRHGFI